LPRSSRRENRVRLRYYIPRAGQTAGVPVDDPKAVEASPGPSWGRSLGYIGPDREKRKGNQLLSRTKKSDVAISATRQPLFDVRCKRRVNDVRGRPQWHAPVTFSTYDRLPLRAIVRRGFAEGC
jgi:hypothetical protein